MRIRHIYITKEGEPMANPDMGVPHKTDSAFWNKYSFLRKNYLKAVEKYHSGLLPFEDREKLKDELFYQVTGGPQVDVPFNLMFKPDTLIPVDIEVEVVEQTQSPNQLNWSDNKTITGKIDGYKFRSVLRIKP